MSLRISKIHEVRNAEVFDSKTLETLTVPEEEILLQHMVDEVSENHSLTEKQRPHIKTVQDHLKQRKAKL